MLHERIMLRPGNDNVYMETYVSHDMPEVAPRVAVVVLPGGGYGGLAHHEGEKIALNYLSAGINSFVLRYTVHGTTPDMKYPMPLVDVANAMKHIKDNAEKYNVDPDKIYILGFSAGGHLAASSGTFWHRKEVYDAAEPMEFGYNKPAGMILCYPVITSGDFAHKGSFHNLLCNNNPTDEEMEYLSVEKHVDENTVRAFLWHNSDDTCVPVENTFLMASALSRQKIPFEAHVYPFGGHGTGLPDGNGTNREWPHQSTWIKLSIDWINNVQ